MLKAISLGYFVSPFLDDYLAMTRNLSDNTIESYSWSISLLLDFCENELGIENINVKLSDISAGTIENFLNWLRKVRKNSPQTCNQRLAALHTFFKYISRKEPRFIEPTKEILTIPFMKQERHLFQCLSRESIKQILDAPNQEKFIGRRDHLILSVLYEGGLRAQEICDIKIGDIRFGKKTYLKIHGKGNKDRTVKIDYSTSKKLQNYIIEQNLDESSYLHYSLFFNKQGKELTRFSIYDIVKKYSKKVFPENTQNISPHDFRHSRATHYLENKKESLPELMSFLGHESLDTTSGYLHVDMNDKFEALNQNIMNDEKKRSHSKRFKDESVKRHLEELIKKKKDL